MMLGFRPRSLRGSECSGLAAGRGDQEQNNYRSPLRAEFGFPA